MSLSLYEHEQRLVLLHEQMSEMLERGEDVPDDMLMVVEDYALGAAEKRESCAAMIRRFDAEVEFIGAEIARLSKIASFRARSADRIRSRILEIMRAHGVERLEGTTAKFSVRQNPPSVEIGLPAEALPVEYQRKIPEKIEADKRAIASALKLGTEIPGCRMKAGDFRLEIK